MINHHYNYYIIQSMIDPSEPWQNRVAAGLDVAAGFISMLPEPFGSVGSTLLGLVGGFFGASTPTTDEYQQLRNQVNLSC